MSILARSEPPPPRVVAVRERRVGIHFDRRESAARFYHETLGLPRWPGVLEIPGGLGAGDASRGVRLEYRHDPHVDPMRARLQIAVTSLDLLAARLEACGWPFSRIRGFFLCDHHIRVMDPCGNVIEIRQICPL